MIVDTHAHVVAPDQERYPFSSVDGVLAEALARRLDTEGLLDQMAGASVDRAVLVQFAHVHGYDNSYVVDSARRHPGWVAAVCGIDSRAPDAAERLSYWVRERGAAGLRLVAGDRGGGMDWLQVPALWQRAADLAVPMCVFFPVGLYAPGLGALGEMLRRFPGVAVVLDHAGNPPWQEGPPLYGLGPLLDLAPHNLYLKFSTVNLHRLAAAGAPAADVLKLLVDRFGAERLLWGSDLPHTPGPLGDMVGAMRAALAALPAAAQAQILGGTALTLYPGLGPS
ncbi:MAG TPA: amidohydrolase family protein [Chloroflexota bacterium]|jgi:predicted TIM-barrel fold metal-dependent hydrolase